MKVTADTNVLIRILLEDDPHQAAIARDAMRRADHIAYSIVSLCEAVWVLRSRAKLPPAEIAQSLRWLLEDRRALFDRALTDAGLALLEAGGDFADAVIAADGRRLGAERLLTFDRTAAKRLAAIDEPADLLA